jgi:hypothetical protein
MGGPMSKEWGVPVPAFLQPRRLPFDQWRGAATVLSDRAAPRRNVGPMSRVKPIAVGLVSAAVAVSLAGCGGSATQRTAAESISLAAAHPAVAAPAGASSSDTSRHSGSSTTSHRVQSASPVQAQANAGGGKPPPVTLPADWPATVPVPKGTLTGASGASPAWVVAETVKGVDTVVIARIVALYKAHGFVLNTAIDNPKVFTRKRLSLTVFWRNRDHGPEATEVLLQLNKN